MLIFCQLSKHILQPQTNERLLVQMEIMIGAEKPRKRGRVFQNSLPRISAFNTRIYARTRSRARTRTHMHTAEAVDCICPSSSGSVVATPAASPPPVRFDSRGRIHHLLGSLGASQLLPRGLTGERSWEALG